ncbi:MAG: alpha/beta hydrolase [Deltaproteobacteria bacterium]|nr:alpha/beta hydrolase [Deltaproteobacteria bacterium]
MAQYQDGFVTINGLRLHYLDWGTTGKPPFLMLHGGSAYAHWWDFVAPALAEDFHVIALDQRGHGDSGHVDPPAYGTRHYLADLQQFIATLGLSQPVLMGHSMGGHNALIYATQHARELAALILVDTDAAYPEAAVQFLQKLGEKPGKTFDSFVEAISRFQLLPRETHISSEKLRYLASFAFAERSAGKWSAKLDRKTLFRDPIDGRPFLGQITCPTLIIRAEHTPVLSNEKITRLVSNLPNGRWVEVKDTYHHVMLDNPDGLVQAVREFLATSLP